MSADPIQLPESCVRYCYGTLILAHDELSRLAAFGSSPSLPFKAPLQAPLQIITTISTQQIIIMASSFSSPRASSNDVRCNSLCQNQTIQARDVDTIHQDQCTANSEVHIDKITNRTHHVYILLVIHHDDIINNEPKIDIPSVGIDVDKANAKGEPGFHKGYVESSPPPLEGGDIHNAMPDSVYGHDAALDPSIGTPEIIRFDVIPQKLQKEPQKLVFQAMKCQKKVDIHTDSGY